MKKFRCQTGLLLIFLVLGYGTISYAQNGDPDPWQDETTDVPIDGGISLLIAAGVAYGAKKAYDHNKKNKN